MPKHEPKSERQTVNNAIQYWLGFVDALEWCKERVNNEEVTLKSEDTKELIKMYRERLHALMIEDGYEGKKTKKNRRRSG
jgi:hypothetical protein